MTHHVHATTAGLATVAQRQGGTRHPRGPTYKGGDQPGPLTRANPKDRPIGHAPTQSARCSGIVVPLPRLPIEKVRGRANICSCRAIDKAGATADFPLTVKREARPARRFLRKAMRDNGKPEKITVDKSSANSTAIEMIRKGQLLLTGEFCPARQFHSLSE
jgi:DDE domain